MTGTNTSGPHWAFALTAMFSAASSAPSGVSENPHARPLRVWRGPAAGEDGSWTPW